VRLEIDSVLIFLKTNTREKNNSEAFVLRKNIISVPQVSTPGKKTRPSYLLFHFILF